MGRTVDVNWRFSSDLADGSVNWRLIWIRTDRLLHLYTFREGLAWACQRLYSFAGHRNISNGDDCLQRAGTSCHIHERISDCGGIISHGRMVASPMERAMGNDSARTV